jgi:hypothetical protein
MESLDPQLQELLAPYKQHFALTEGGKLQCSLNGHTLPPRADALRPFIQ